MKFPRRSLIIGAVAVVVIAVIGVAVFSTQHARRTTQDDARTTYYCPMHPTYTSDRPGDCPICNMKLVPKEPAPAAAPAAAPGKSGKALKDICYLHECPMVHQGRPCPMLVVAKKGEPVTCPLCGTHVAEAAEAPEGKKILYWTDPMMPGYKSDKPGKSPMGMDLVPVYETGPVADDAPEGYAPILVTPQKQQLIGVTTARVARRPMTKTIRTAGRIAYDPELYQAEQEYVQALHALDQTGTGSSPELLEQATRLVKSSRVRLRLLGLSDALIDEMAGWSGPDARLLGTDSVGEVWLYAPVYEFELPLVAVGQTVRVESLAATGRTLDGVIRAIDPVLDPATRSARVRAVLRDPDRFLKPEMFVDAFLRVDLGEVLAVPEEAVFQTGTRQIAFVDQGQGIFEPRDITVGVRADGFYEVKAGLTDGEPVVTSGNFLIDSESRLKAALEGASRWSPPDSSGGRNPERVPSEAEGRVEGPGHQHGQ